MIELIIVIVVAGILAAVMIPRLERDSLREATNQVVRHIQYTQHLAMMNDVYDANADWRPNRWAIDLCTKTYSIARSNGTANAMDPLTQRPIDGTDNNLANKGISTIEPSTGNCKIVFDNLGRPYGIQTIETNTTGIDLLPDTIITLTDSSSREANITIRRETGYVSSIVY